MRVQLDVGHIDVRKSVEENPLAFVTVLPANVLIPGNRFLRYQHVRFGVKLFGFIY
jgi:hypothetical protein